MKTLQELGESLQEAVDNFNGLDRQERIQYLIELSDQLEPIPQELLALEDKVRGCMTTAYVHVDVTDGVVTLSGDSASIVIKGFMQILLSALSGLTVDAILHDSRAQIEEFIGKIDHELSLTNHRANSFANIYNHILRKIEEQK